MTKLNDLLANNMALYSDAAPMSQEERERLFADDYNAMEGHLNGRDGYDCRLCRNKGLIMRVCEPRPGYWSTVSHDCECRKIRRTIRNLQSSGLKNIVSDYTFDKFIASEPWQQTLKSAAEAYAEQPSGWFFAGGQSGAGKTHLCTAICRKLLYDGKTVKYMLWRDETVRLKALINNADEYRSAIDAFKNAQVLYIDDLFKTARLNGSAQAPTPADINIAFEILNHRYNNPDSLTVISSECSLNDILSMDEAIGGRIFERAKALFIKQDPNKNYRLKEVVEL